YQGAVYMLGVGNPGVGDIAGVLGPLYKEKETDYRDDTAWFTQSLKTGELSFGQLQGGKRFRRLRVLLDHPSGSSGGLTVKVTNLELGSTLQQT
ncbi:hypothetical protein, partial [Salmonella sp. SAL4431]|uniref:hypothetical protein n=1 Tax=Salmonella sp. SAL4431 TaxID=3159886 RepID=UPI00397BB4B7